MLVEVTDHSGGDVIDPPVTVHDCRDYEDDRMLDLAVEIVELDKTGVSVKAIITLRRTPRPKVGMDGFYCGFVHYFVADPSM